MRGLRQRSVSCSQAPYAISPFSYIFPMLGASISAAYRRLARDLKHNTKVYAAIIPGTAGLRAPDDLDGRYEHASKGPTTSRHGRPVQVTGKLEQQAAIISGST